jgi:hypothetical protein
MADPTFIVYAPNFTPDYTACQYYRIEVPLRMLTERDLAITLIDRGKGTAEDTFAAMLKSDINLFYALQSDNTLYRINVLKGITPSPNASGCMQYPPSCVYDVDDNTDYVHPYNEAFCNLGVRNYPDGTLLRPGDKMTTTLADGSELPFWEDEVTTHGSDTFSITRNLQRMATRHAIIRACDGVTVPSRSLARYMHDVIGAANVHVFPNTIIPGDYEHYDVARPSNVRILWQGSQSHLVDWHPLRDAIAEVARLHPNVTWVIWGEKFDWIMDVIPEEQLEFHYWVQYPAYKLKRGLLGIDINLCLLHDNLFNRCKSAIKWYEGSIWPDPEATLAGNAGPYRDEIVDNETGLLYSTPSDFVQKLSLLITDADLRRRLGHAARRWVFDNRTPDRTIPPLFEFYQELRGQRVREHLMR